MEKAGIFKVMSIDFAPAKGCKVCQNCQSFEKYGVKLGHCTKKGISKLDYHTCKKFDPK